MIGPYVKVMEDQAKVEGNGFQYQSYFQIRS